MRPNVKGFFDKATWTMTYVVTNSENNEALIIDPVWDYDPAASKLTTESVEQVIAYVREKNLKVLAILETHAHADHVSGAQVLKDYFPEAKIGIGKSITKVQSVFKDIYHLDDVFKTDGSQFDLLLEEGAPLQIGSYKIETLSTPGHTPACSSYLIGDAVFSGDVIFMPDYGTGRCDFPAGSAEDLYHSVSQKLYKLPDETRVFVGHDYQPDGRELQFESTIGEQKKKNIHITAETPKEKFIQFRQARDKTLAAPRLLLPSIQVNIDGGRLPQPESNKKRYLKIPLTES